MTSKYNLREIVTTMYIVDMVSSDPWFDSTPSRYQPHRFYRRRIRAAVHPRFDVTPSSLYRVFYLYEAVRGYW